MKKRADGQATFSDLVVSNLGGPKTAAMLDSLSAAVPWKQIVAPVLKLPIYTKYIENPSLPGERPIDPAVMLRCLMLAKWFNLSDPQLEEQLRQSYISARLYENERGHDVRRSFSVPKIRQIVPLLLGMLLAPPAWGEAAKARDVTFLVTSDCHYVEQDRKNNRNSSNGVTIDEMNRISEVKWSEALGGKQIAKPRGVIVFGDCIDDGDRVIKGKNISAEQYAAFVADFGLDGTEGRLKLPVFVARHVVIDFSKPAEGTLLDSAGRPTGLTHRLPGTGGQLPAHDSNLRLDASTGSLALTTTRSDLNHRFKLAEGEYLGLRLADLGFTGEEDFDVSVVVPNIPGLAAVGQFGLYAGSRNDLCIRGGLISQRTANRYSQFFVNNEAGLDQNAMYVGLVETGNDVRLTLRRRAGNYSLTVGNLTSGASSTLSIRPLASLATERQMFVGFFGANTGSEERQTLSIMELSATVWTKQ